MILIITVITTYAGANGADTPRSVTTVELGTTHTTATKSNSTEVVTTALTEATTTTTTTTTVTTTTKPITTTTTTIVEITITQEVTATEVEVVEEVVNPSPVGNDHLTAYSGVYDGPNGHETYYNLPMQGVVSIMRSLGYSEEEYPYWEREDGAKMFGDYIMVAADLNIRPKGTILETSLGTAMVCDTGTFTMQGEPVYQIDIAVNW
ncbi:MAG: hypothetical protein J6D03_07765 [Clostridia bacterium]|nr:hypothetical protein [Clostridia bacterium]